MLFSLWCVVRGLLSFHFECDRHSMLIPLGKDACRRLFCEPCYLFTTLRNKVNGALTQFRLFFRPDSVDVGNGTAEAASFGNYPLIRSWLYFCEELADLSCCLFTSSKVRFSKCAFLPIAFPFWNRPVSTASRGSWSADLYSFADSVHTLPFRELHWVCGLGKIGNLVSLCELDDIHRRRLRMESTRWDSPGEHIECRSTTWTITGDPPWITFVAPVLGFSFSPVSQSTGWNV